MRQAAWLYLLIVVALAACSSVPQRNLAKRGSGASGYAANGPFRTPPGLPEFIDHSVGEEEISIQAMSLVGVPYRWGGNTPASGFDCSGLVRYVVERAADVNLPRTTAEMSEAGHAIEPSGVAPGDLIFFNTTGRAHSHVGIYVGKMRFVNAPSTGGTVRIDYLTNPYWARHFDGIRRVASRHVLPTPRSTPFDAPAVLAATPPASAAAVAPEQRPPASPSAAANQHVDAIDALAADALSGTAAGGAPPNAVTMEATPARSAEIPSTSATTANSAPADPIAQFANSAYSTVETAETGTHSLQTGVRADGSRLER